MSSNKEKEKKDFLISTRKSVSAGATSVPVWILQKAGKRIWNPKQKRHWSMTSMGKDYRKRKKGEKRKKCGSNSMDR